MTDLATFVEDLKQPWRHGEHVDARGVVLNETLVLDGLDIRGFDLSGSKLLGGLSARGTRFLGLTWLRGSEINGSCDLRETHFKMDFRGDDLVAQDLDLTNCVLQGVLSVAGARLASLSIRKALVMANMTMERAVVRGSVDLTEAEIMRGLWTEKAQIGLLKSRGVEISGRVRLPG